MKNARSTPQSRAKRVRQTVTQNKNKSTKHAAEKLRRLERVIRLHVGSTAEARSAIKALAGHDNLTTDSVLKSWNALPVENKAQNVRLAKEALLKPFVTDGLSWCAVRALGFRGLGERFYAKCVKGEVATDRRHGSKLVDAGKIYLEWHNFSYARADGSRVFYRTQAEIAQQVARSAGCSKATALRGKPDGIKRAKRPEDLCPLCEELRSARLKALQGKGWCPPAGTDLREAPIATVNGWVAASDLEVTLPEKLEPLVKHEQLNIMLHKLRDETMHTNKCKDTLSIVLDWAAPVEFRGFRQTSAGFHNKVTYAMLGACASVPSGNGEVVRALHYFHGYDPERGCVKDGVRTAVRAGYLVDCCVAHFKQVTGTHPLHIKIFMDCAQHFRNKVVAQWLVSDAPLTARSSVYLVWTAQYHGKSCLDGSFYDAKQWVKNKGDFNPASDLASVVAEAYSGVGNFSGLVFPQMDAFRPFGIDGVRHAIIPHMAATHSLQLEDNFFKINHLLLGLEFCAGAVIRARYDMPLYTPRQAKAFPLVLAPGKGDASLARLGKRLGRL